MTGDDRWTLTVVYDSLEQQAADPYREGLLPFDYGRDLANFVRNEMWTGLIEEELDECVLLSDDHQTVTLHTDLIDGLDTIFEYVVMRSIPLSATLTRN